MYVKAKKSLGQHFLKNQEVAKAIVESVVLEPSSQSSHNLLEVGPGMGVLTQYLVGDKRYNLKLVELDGESVNYLHLHYPELKGRIIEGDFLKLQRDELFNEKFIIIGNFPYNISSQIFFKVLEWREEVTQVVGMLQREVAERLASPPGNRSYGLLSVLLQSWYHIEYLFGVEAEDFNPPPKVKSAVIRVVRNSRESLGCDERLFKEVVKTTFNQRRKAIRNSIKPLLHKLSTPNSPLLLETPLLSMRPEQLSVEQFIELTQLLERATREGDW